AQPKRNMQRKAWRTIGSYADPAMDAKRILERRAQFIAAALASCTPAARPVDHATRETIPLLADAEVVDTTTPDAAPPLIEDAAARKIVLSVCLSIIVMPKIT